MAQNNQIIRHLLLLSSLSLLLTGCGGKLNAPENPCSIPEHYPAENLRLALVLGGGGAKGLAHVGVIEEFEKAGIPIDVIIGCSAGSIVGALYADCPNSCTLKDVLEPLRVWSVLDISLIYDRFGLVRGRTLCRYLKKNLSVSCFEDLRIPFYAVATDILEGKAVCIGSGPLVPAIHASAAIPFVFSPVYLYERWLVDGGVADPIPVDFAKKTGASVVVAVDLSGLLPDVCPTNLFGVASRSAEIKFQLQTDSCLIGADIVIAPELGKMGLFDDKNPEKVYEAGRRAARVAIPHILNLLSERGCYPVIQNADQTEAAIE